MAIVKTARPLEIGDEILPWANNDEDYAEFERLTLAAKEEIKLLPQGAKNITFLMKKEYRDRFKQNTRILYKKSINKFDFKTGAPDYKDHWLTFNWGIVRTSNFEEIAYLDMHPKWFVREANRELTPTEKMAKELEEAKAKLKAYEELEKQKEILIKGMEDNGKAERQEERQEQKEEEKTEKTEKPQNDDERKRYDDEGSYDEKIIEKVKQRGRPRKS